MNLRASSTPSRHHLDLLAACIGFAALSVYWTWPLASHLNSRIPHDAGDPLLNTWILWWNSQAVPLTRAWWDAPMFVPMPGALALSEHLAGLAVVTTPLQLAGGSPLLAYNVSLLLSYALSGLFAYVLVVRMTGSTFAGIVTGLAFGFGPYRAGQLAHLQVLTSQWMPMALLGMHEYLNTGRRSWLVLFGSAWLLQALSNGYYMLFFPVVIGLWLAWFVEWRTNPSRGVAIMVTWLIASLPLIPNALGYRSVHQALGLSRTTSDIARFSASPGAFVSAPPMLALWPHTSVPNQEHYLFPGLTATLVTAMVLAVVLVRRRRPRNPLVAPFLFYAAATVVLWALTLGPGAEGTTAWLHPYRWLTWLPGYDGLRVPARFAMLASLCLAVSAGLATTLVQPRALAWRAAAVVLVTSGLLVDGLMQPMPLIPPPGRVALPGPANAAVLEIPPNDSRVSVGALYRATFHARDLINGYSGYIPTHYALLNLAVWRGDPSVFQWLAQGRPLVIIVNHRSDPRGRFRDMVARLPGVERYESTGAGSIFLLTAQPYRQIVPPGRALPASGRVIADNRIEIDLGGMRSVRALEIPLRDRFEKFSGRLLIEASDDGTAWRQVWLGWTGGLALEATLTEPLVAPVRIPLPDVRARYLRIYPASEWMATETRVLEGRK